MAFRNGRPPCFRAPFSRSNQQVAGSIPAGGSRNLPIRETYRKPALNGGTARITIPAGTWRSFLWEMDSE